MPNLEWNAEKNSWLAEMRGVSFDDVVCALHEGGFIAIDKNPGKHRLQQYVLIVNIKEYAYMVPFVDDGEKWFLKTVIPNRKLTKKYIINKKKS